MVDPRSRLPWLLVAASMLFAVLLVYVFFAAYLPVRQHVVRLEAELRELYAREAALQTRLAQQELREQQTTAVAAERDALATRLEEVERELAALRGRRR